MSAGGAAAVPHVDVLDREVRVLGGGQQLVRSTAVRRVLEGLHEVRYYALLADVAAGVLVAPRYRADHDGRGPATVWTVRTARRRVADGAWEYRSAPPGRPDLRGLVSFAWPAMDRMLEEQEEVSVHPRHPGVRVDVLRTARPVEVSHGGVLLARTSRALLLAETGRPDRCYVPREDVRVALTASTTRTECPYKGLATYWSAAGLDDVAWGYSRPIDRSAAPVAGAVCFAPERVDTRVGGVLRARPVPAPPPAHLTGDWVRLDR